MCIEVIFEIKDTSPELKRLYEKIKNLYWIGIQLFI
jgi:hypothetical protein